ncbi:MerR family transcriptional regulator [Serinicoccus sp. LYQ131]|uniref:MerR family transcriptional regulator n=1 Tax=Serinicoccus sp. LYQ131 TaxID=3378797 RepID=UPI003853A4FF
MVISWEAPVFGLRRDSASPGASNGTPAVDVAERFAVPLSTVAAWDHDHGVGPHRDVLGRRGYNRTDVLGVGVMSRFTEHGVPADEAARVVLTMSAPQLQAQLAGFAQDDSAEVAHARACPEGFVLHRVDVIVAAARDLDIDALANLYAETLDKYGLLAGWTQILAPSLSLIGTSWEHGLLGVESEHLAVDLLTSELSSYTRRHRADRSVPISVVLAGAEGDRHWLPLRVVEAQLARCGVRCVALGADVPADALAATITRHRPHHVLVWASLSRPDPDPLWQHPGISGCTTHIVTAGPGWDPTAVRAQHPGPPRWVDNATGLRQALHFLTVPGLVGYDDPPSSGGSEVADLVVVG